MRAEERLVPSLAIPDVTRGSPAPIQAQGLAEAWAANDPKMRYLMEELITQRLEGAQLSIELAEARVEAAQVKEISHGQAELLTVLIAALRIRDRQAASLRAETAELRQRLDAAQTELEREGVEKHRLAAELVAAHRRQRTGDDDSPGNLSAARAPQIGHTFMPLRERGTGASKAGRRDAHGGNDQVCLNK
jgi:hypothetical protein